jgi:hypothetical protein
VKAAHGTVASCTPPVSASQPNDGTDPRVDSEQFLVLDSCHSTWLFDQASRRFARVLKSGEVHSAIATAWRDYDHIVLESSSGAFLVFLDSSSTRLIRSWRHIAHCEHCGGEPTAELSIAELRRALDANTAPR